MWVTVWLIHIDIFPAKKSEQMCSWIFADYFLTLMENLSLALAFQSIIALI